MIIRIRSNLGMWKVTVVNGDVTLGDLKSHIFKEFKFSIADASPEDIVLSTHMSDEGIGSFIDSSRTLNQLDIHHGSMLYITSKLKQNIVEKAFVGEDGNLVEAGTKISIEDNPGPAPGPTTAKAQFDASGIANSNNTASSPDLGSGSSNPKKDSDEQEQLEEPAMTDEEAIAKLMEEDFALADTGGGGEFASPGQVRAPDQTQSMRLFDPHPDDLDEDMGDMRYFGGMDLHRHMRVGATGMHMNMNMHMNMGNDMANLMSQFLDPLAARTAAARHGRQPLSDLAAPRPAITTGVVNKKKRKEKKERAFLAPEMNQEVVDNARAAGMSEEEIREMFDAEYSEMLQANILSNEFDDSVQDEDDEEEEEEEGGAGVVHVVDELVEGYGRLHNRFEDLTLDDSDSDSGKDQDQAQNRGKASSQLTTGGGGGIEEGSLGFLSAEEERIIEEILASSLAEAEEAQGRAVLRAGSASGRGFGGGGGGGGGSEDVGEGSGRKEPRKKAKPSSATLYTHSTVGKDWHSDRSFTAPGASVSGSVGRGGLALEGRRVELAAGTGRQAEAAKAAPPKTGRTGSTRSSSHVDRDSSNSNRGQSAAGRDSEPVRFPRPVSGVSVKRLSQSSRGALSNGGSFDREDSDSADPLLALALKMSEKDTDPTTSTSTATATGTGAGAGAIARNRKDPSSSSSRSGSRGGSGAAGTTTSNTAQPSARHIVSGTRSHPAPASVSAFPAGVIIPSARFRTEPSTKPGQRSSVSQRAVELVERLNAEFHPVQEKEGAAGGRSVGVGGRHVVSASGEGAARLPGSLGRFRSDFSEDEAARAQYQVPASSAGYAAGGAGGRSNRRRLSAEGGSGGGVAVDVSEMDEDEQLAWALAQSML